MTLDVIGTAGHSAESLSFYLREEKALFSGDAIPVPGDIPIYISPRDSIGSLRKLLDLPDVDCVYSAWDEPRKGKEVRRVMETALDVLTRIDTAVRQTVVRVNVLNEDILMTEIGRTLGLEHFVKLPLLRKSLAYHVAEVLAEC